MGNCAGAAIAIVLIVIALCPPALYMLATGLQKLVWRIVAHADAVGEYADAYRRHYQRRSES